MTSKVARLPCGCPDMDEWEWLDPCPGHVWSHWHPNNVDALAEFRLCFYCGVMQTQRLNTEPRPDPPPWPDTPPMGRKP